MVTADSSVGTIDGPTGSFTMGCSTALGGQNFTTDLVSTSTAGGGNIYIQVTTPGSKTISTFVIPVTVT